MLDWISRILLTVIILMTGMLVVTASTWLADGPIAGRRLIGHMIAGGGLVTVLPLFGLLFLHRAVVREQSTRLERFGYWAMILASLATIGSVFVCMLPILSSEQMRSSMGIHGYAGFAMVPGLLLLLIGRLHWRRMNSIRSSTPG
jgi:hypothetical protein